MSGFEGFFELLTPADLKKKLEYDISRIRRNRLDSYAAFDFFVTAEHILDWKNPGRANEQRRKAERSSSPLLRVTSHLANGAKHFRAEARHLKAVDGTGSDTGYFSPDYFDSAYFDTGCLVVRLMGEDARELGQTITVLDLAEMVLAYWENDLRS